MIKSDKDCKQPPGTVIPVINKSKCEAKDKCTAICPYNVFELRKLTQEEKQSLSFFVRLKVRTHGNKKAFVTNDQCRGCSYCVTACPEKAIKLIPAIT